MGDADFSLPSFAMVSIIYVIINFCRRPLLKFAISRRLRFSLLIFCSASEFRDSSGQGYKRLLLVRTVMVSGKHTCIMLGSFQMHNAQNVS